MEAAPVKMVDEENKEKGSSLDQVEDEVSVIFCMDVSGSMNG